MGIGEFPTPLTVQWIRFDGSVTDELGNIAPSYAAPVDRPAIAWRAASVETSSGDGHAAQEKYDIELFAPPSFAPDVRDRIVVDGRLFEVVGSNRGLGFHNWNPGGAIMLRRVEG